MGCLIAVLLVAGCLSLGRVATTCVSTPADADLTSLRAIVAHQEAKFRDIVNAQGRFVGNIAHEIKTPLTIVLTELELLVRSSDDPLAVQGHAKSIAGDVQHLSHLVDSFLRLALPFAQSDTSHHVPVDVHDFVMESMRRSLVLARATGVGIVVTLAEPVIGATDPEVLGDVVLLEAMLDNLVRNAVRFSPRGEKVEIRVDVREGTIRIAVRDRGKGIAAEHRASVFDWFFQSPGLTLPSAGTGFGLAIAKRVAEHHGGTIELRDADGHGSDFEVVLPRHSVAADAAS